MESETAGKAGAIFAVLFIGVSGLSFCFHCAPGEGYFLQTRVPDVRIDRRRGFRIACLRNRDMGHLFIWGRLDLGHPHFKDEKGHWDRGHLPLEGNRYHVPLLSSVPISARIVVHPNGTGTLFVRMLAHAGIPLPPKKGQKPVSLDEWYKLILDRETPLGREEVSHALALFQRIRFRDESNDKNSLDGSDWIIESKVDRKYRLVDFRNGHSQAARDFGAYLVFDLGGVKLPPRAVY